MKKLLAMSALFCTLISCSSSDDNTINPPKDGSKMFRIEVTNTSENLDAFEKNITLIFMTDNDKFKIVETTEWDNVLDTIKGMITFFKVDNPVQTKEVYTASYKALTGSYSFGHIKHINDDSELKVNVKVFGDNELVREKDFHINKNTNAEAFVVEF